MSPDSSGFLVFHFFGVIFFSCEAVKMNTSRVKWVDGESNIKYVFSLVCLVPFPGGYILLYITSQEVPKLGSYEVLQS